MGARAGGEGRRLVARGRQRAGDTAHLPPPRSRRGRRRAEGVDRVLARTEIAQPAICLASLLHARYLAHLGLQPQVVGGHSLGELTAFHLAGAFDEETLIKLAALRGRAMAARRKRSLAGAMASLACSRTEAETLIRGIPGYVVVANINSPRQTVVSGEEEAVREVMSGLAAAASWLVVCRFPTPSTRASSLPPPTSCGLPPRFPKRPMP